MGPLIDRLIGGIAEGTAHAAGRPNGLIGIRTWDIETVRWIAGDETFHCEFAPLGDLIRVTGVLVPNRDSSRNNIPGVGV